MTREDLADIVAVTLMHPPDKHFGYTSVQAVWNVYAHRSTETLLSEIEHFWYSDTTWAVICAVLHRRGVDPTSLRGKLLR